MAGGCEGPWASFLDWACGTGGWAEAGEGGVCWVDATGLIAMSKQKVQIVGKAPRRMEAVIADGTGFSMVTGNCRTKTAGNSAVKKKASYQGIASGVAKKPMANKKFEHGG